ncbi:MAG: YHYH protein, partial [SAR324 cluster bacterium]|nr:YHYH protein [SAR324 cluster bacterium]
MGSKAIRIVLLAGLGLAAAGCAADDSSSKKVPDCSTGTASAEFSSDVPTWIQDNFTCIKASMDGSNIVIETRDLPVYTSYYYGSTHDRYDPTPPTDTSNPNLISEQSYTLTIPSSPAVAASPSQSGLGEVGVAVDGTILFNNQAAPGDSLANEESTLDANDGHPSGQGIYHYHVEMSQLTAGDANLIGIALDGFPIFGAREANNSVAVDA